MLLSTITGVWRFFALHELSTLLTKRLKISTYKILKIISVLA